MTNTTKTGVSFPDTARGDSYQRVTQVDGALSAISRPASLRNTFFTVRAYNGRHLCSEPTDASRQLTEDEP